MHIIDNRFFLFIFNLLTIVLFSTASCLASENDSLTFKNDTLLVLDSARLQIIKTAKNYAGIKYRRGGMNEKGFDCSGFVKYVFGKIGYNLPRTSLSQYNDCKSVLVDSVMPGDLVFFKTRGKRVSHVGIYIGNRQFIHSPRRGKTVGIGNLDEEYWKKRCVAAATIFE
jgi:cell wall-associated NlpC family hydrolase